MGLTAYTVLQQILTPKPTLNSGCLITYLSEKMFNNRMDSVIFTVGILFYFNRPPDVSGKKKIKKKNINQHM